MEFLREEVEKRALIHEAAVPNIQNKDQIIAEYRSKTDGYSHALEVMQRAGTWADVLVEVI